MDRRLVISAFRNIGFENEKPSYESLVLNHSLEKGKMGDLVILIGANNSGKSNVLAALMDYRRKQIQDRDITDLYMESDCHKPSLKLLCENEQEKYAAKLENGRVFISCPEREQHEFVPEERIFHIDENNKQRLIHELRGASITEQNIGVPFNEQKITKLVQEMPLETDACPDSLFQETLTKYINILTEYLTHKNDSISSFMSCFGGSEFPYAMGLRKEYNAYIEKNKAQDSLDFLNNSYSNKYGYNFEPNIFEYREEGISNANLSIPYDRLQQDKFFNEVFKAIDVD